MRLLLLIAALTAAGCASQTTASVDITDAAAHFSTDEALEESAYVLAQAHAPSADESTYTTLCGGKECSGTAMTYTQAFREVASLAIALRALHAVCEDPQLERSERLVLQDAQQSLEQMRVRVNELHAKIERLDPRKDFELDHGRQQSAAAGLKRARGHLDDARALADSLRGALSARIGDAGSIELGWEDARAPEDPRAVLKRRVLQNPELAPKLAEYGGSIDDMIDAYGHAAIDRRLTAEERRSAAVRSVSTTRALTELELTRVAVTGPLLPDGVREWFADARVAVAACLSSPRSFEIGLIYGADGVVAALQVVDPEPSLTACVEDGLVGTALTGTPLPSGGLVTLEVQPRL